MSIVAVAAQLPGKLKDPAMCRSFHGRHRLSRCWDFPKAAVQLELARRCANGPMWPVAFGSKPIGCNVIKLNYSCEQLVEISRLSRKLDKKDTYHYGTLIPLIRENLIALEKHHQGKLGFWARSRASSRNGVIDKFIQKIIDHKTACGYVNPIEEILLDISFIQQDTDVWDDVSDEQVEFLRKLLTGS